MSGLIRKYLEELSGLLRCGPEEKERILAEAEEHLTLAAERERAKGLTEEEAAMRAVVRFGSPQTIAEMFKDLLDVQWIRVDEPVKFTVNEARQVPIEEYVLPPEKGAGGAWNRFTNRSRQILFDAQEHAVRLAGSFVGTEHLLLGLIQENDSAGAQTLIRLGVSLHAVRDALLWQMSKGDPNPPSDVKMITPRAKRSIDLAYEEARALNHNYIGSEHLLLGLIREGDGLAGRVLLGMGVDLDRAREEVRAWHAGMEARKKKMHPFEVLHLRTESGPRAVPVSEIQKVKVRLTSGEWVAGVWGGTETVGTPPGDEGHDVGDIMVTHGWITPEELERTREVLRENPGPDVGQALIDQGFADEVAVTQARAKAMNLRLVNLEYTHPQPEAIAALPARTARQYGAIPVMKKGNDLLVAVTDASDPELMDALRLASGCRVTLALAPPALIRKALREWYGDEDGDNGGAPVPAPKPPAPPAPPEYQPVPT